MLSDKDEKIGVWRAEVPKPIFFITSLIRYSDVLALVKRSNIELDLRDARILELESELRQKRISSTKAALNSGLSIAKLKLRIEELEKELRTK